MNTSEQVRSRYGTVRLRLAMLACAAAFAMVLVLVELKTGVPIGKGRAYRAHHEPRSWGEVWTELLEPERRPLYLAIFAMLILATEVWVRFVKTPAEADEDAGDALGEAASKPLTKPWLIATGGYTAILAALYMFMGSEWAATSPMPVAVLL